MCRKTTATHSKKFHLFVENFKTNKYETQTKENSPLVFIKWNAFVSCSLEEDYATKKRYEEKMKISHVSFGELLKNKKFSTAYSKVLQQQSLTSKTGHGRTVSIYHS